MLSEVPAQRDRVPSYMPQQGGRGPVTLANSVIDEEAAREIASRLEAEHPLWIVVFGVYTQQFVCFPKFEAPIGTMVVATYPDALPVRMRRAEEVNIHPVGVGDA
jgi:hypothetical protein